MKKRKFILNSAILLLFCASLGSCKGVQGDNGAQGIQGETGEKGSDGVGIESISKINSEGLIDTYSILYTDGRTTTFTVTNGSQGIQGIQGEAGNDGHSPIITIGENGNWFIDGVDTTKPAQGIKGETGNGISKIEKTSIDGLVDTYTITFTNGDTTTFTVTNGSQGIQGIQGETGNDGHSPIITIGENGNWFIDGQDTTKPAQGIKGDTGNGISKIEKTSTEGLVDTYTITFTNGDTTTFTVTNGSQGIQGIQGETGNDGHSPIITIGENGNWFIDGQDTTKPAQGIKGDTGNGISKIEKTSTEGLVDTYTITFTNGDTTTFTVTNGSQGIQGIQGEAGNDGHSPIITIGENGNWFIDGQDTTKPAQGVQGETGNGISKIEKTSTDGLVDTYTITFTNGTTTTFTITNGESGKSAYEIYLKYHPEYEGTEEDWINSFSNTPRKVEITFDSDGGTSIDSQEINHGSKITKPADPVKANHNFEGWFLGDEKWVFAGYIATENMTLKAKWTETYTEGLSFSLLSNGNSYGVSVGAATEQTSIYVPSVYNGKPVKEILTDGFKNATKLTNISLPSSLTKINANAFNGCSNLAAINIPTTVTSIGNYAFAECTKITSITFSNNVTAIGTYICNGCTALKTVVIGTKISTIPTYAFNGCKNLTTITIPASVKKINSYAFYGCKAITKLNISGSTSFTTTATKFYRRNDYGVYSTTDYAQYGSDKAKTFNVTVSNASQLITLGNDHSGVFYIDGNSSNYFVWYYMQNWTRS